MSIQVHLTGLDWTALIARAVESKKCIMLQQKITPKCLNPDIRGKYLPFIENLADSESSPPASKVSELMLVSLSFIWTF